MLNVRRFAAGLDEPDWVEVLNAAYKEYVSWWRGLTVEEMREQEKSSNFDFEGRFIAELDGKPVGVIHAHVDRLSGEKKGFIYSFCVVPEFRGRGAEEELARIAIDELEKHGVNSIQTWTGSEREDRIRLLEKFGFKLVFRTYDMVIDLGNIPSNMGENTEVSIRPLRKSKEQDIETLNWLINECFKEYPNYRPQTTEETRQSLLNSSNLKEQEFFFAVLEQKNVGYIGIGIDARYNIEQKVKSGRITGIGVLKPYRKKGFGARLLLQGLETLRNKGMTKASLDTEDYNPTKPMKLYEKLGFRLMQEYVTYKKDYTDTC